MAGYILLSCVTASFYIYVVSGCDINKCMKSNPMLMPQSCQAYTQTLQCIKKEYDSCTNHAGKTHIMMSMQYVMKSGHSCGFDMGQMTQMMTAHTGLMTSLLNGTNGMSAMMMGGDGPFDFDDDDGPFDDGPFDDGPFDDGPFDDMGGHGMFPFLAAGGAGKAGTPGSNPPQAPGMLPTFGGGSMMQSNEHMDHDNGAGHMGQSWLTMAIWTLCLLYFLN